MQEIVRILSVQTGNSVTTINNLKQAIKSLRQELNKAKVGSREYNETLRQLTVIQRQYASINRDITDRAKANSLNLQEMTKLGQNLAKTYSSINAIVGLLGDNNEDLNKQMLKVQRTIQLIQGLSGIGGLIKQIPQLINGFKSWLSSFDPLERKVANIQKGINGISPQKLNQLSKLGSIKIGDVSAKATALPTSGRIDTNRIGDIQQETRVITALNQARENELEKLEKLKTKQAEQNKVLNEAKVKYAAAQQTINQAGISISEFTQRINELRSTSGKITWNKDFENTLKLIEKTASGLHKAETELASAETEAKKINAQITETEGNIAKLDKQIKNVGTTASKASSFFKNLFSTVGWTLLVSAIISGIYALGRWISNIQTAAKEQKEFNKAIREGTAQSASKAIVVLKELSIGYKKVGDSAEAKKKFIDEYNDKIKETGIAVNDVNTADDVFIKNTNKYIQALMQRAKAQATENYAIKKYEEYLVERGKLEEKVNNPTLTTAQSNSVAGVVGSGWVSQETIDEQRRVRDQLLEENRQKNQKALDDADKEMDSKLNKWFTDIANLQASYAGIFDTSGSTSTTSTSSPKENPFDLEEEILKTYLEDIERYQDSLKSAKDKEIEETEQFYDRLIVNAAKFGNDYQQYVKAREQAIADIEKKYADEELENQKKLAEDRLEELDKQINRIRSRYDTSNIQKVREQTYQTNYRQPISTTSLGLGPTWLNTYQSKDNVKDEYNAQISYNNKILELTKQRIEQENKLLQQQLEVEGITADRRMEIERTLAENKIALSDAVLDNEEANLQAYKKMQEARQEALLATLSVASNVTGGLATLSKVNSEDEKKSQKEREKAFKAYKALSISQAIIDTYKSANEAYTAMAGIPYVGPYLAPVAAMAAIISGIANVKRIQNESMSSSTTTTTLQAPTYDSAPIEYQRQLLGDKELDKLNDPIKCYMVESEATSVINKVKMMESNATF